MQLCSQSRLTWSFSSLKIANAKLALLLQEWRQWLRRIMASHWGLPGAGAMLEASASPCASSEPSKQPDSRTMPAGTGTNPIGAKPGSPRQAQQPSQLWEMRPEDFALGRILGTGSFATVVLARELATSRDYALKILEKRHVIKEKVVRYVASEREALARLDHPFFVKLYFTFQDQEKLYFGLSYARNGDLLRFLEKVGPLAEPLVCFYSAELVCALEYLHGLDIIHRDLKPENILLTDDMHLQITDFGSAKILAQAGGGGGGKPARMNSFVGTAEYVSPELLLDKGTCKSSDLWALGCIIYYLVAQEPPFQAQSEYFIFQKIMRLNYAFPKEFFPKARDLVEKLLVLDSAHRLGCEDMGGYRALKAHPFFETVTWDDLHLQTPPLARALLEDKNYFGEVGTRQSRSLPLSWAAVEPAFPQPSNNVERYIHCLDANSLELDLNFSGKERRLLLEKQAWGNPWHRFVGNRLILKMGRVDLRKGLFASAHSCQLLLTEGPCLYLVDPVNKFLNEEIFWSPQLPLEVKSVKTFFVHTPDRIYHLMDPSGNAPRWCQKIRAAGHMQELASLEQAPV
ncbi:3-phosphoinositide-dependent protein kinase 1-like [Monodelphis domestica]|uniref:3-phosphoinositide-dependent protein kinase 1-like n=1 Tax=Monodelphis domestica TaxID=13616 RepID=UPI0024E1F4D5|nr:3-phosphoinositide-dependent protein kinase 1-like [Monodelphis domestica]